MKRWQYNLLILPVALFIRLGEWAEEMDRRAEHIHGLRP